MNKRMLIDTTHAEETRVVVMDGNRLEDYDVEASAKKQLKGNIYLAKVIRVEPSLQAAFVEYGGNRHGFLAFSEIHPDYYQIPVADRERLLALQEEEARADEAQLQDDFAEAGPGSETDAETGPESVSESIRESVSGTTELVATDDEAAQAEQEPLPETVGGETDTGEEGAVQRRIARFLRSYKIQEVIRRRQVLLVQVVKEERGNKGAALTTYISLAGRYCVLMPNSLRGGGVSRKITSVADRRRLKDVIAELQIPRGMAMIVRTAGAQRPRPEIMRDCEYLLRLWDDIRDHTMRSMAPALIYEEASLIKRAIRDIYTRDVGEILVDGEAGWKSAREFMRMLMPQSAQKVKCWQNGAQPLFSHFNVEGLLDSMLSPTVQLRSGGYLVINQAEALVAIDVNSGRATRERNIEETALRTNLEAAEEVARQLRLRDLAGLIVIDFIDMESRKHNAMVERRLKDALRTDRARIQVGAISHFGLLEMSRQRLRPSITESTFTPCPHCQGTGIIRGTESATLHVLRAIEEEGARRRAAEIMVHVAAEIALYILNNKRVWLDEIEKRHKMRVTFAPDPSLAPSQVRIERTRPQTERFEPVAPQPVPAEAAQSGQVREIPILTAAPAETPQGETTQGEAALGEAAQGEANRAGTTPAEAAPSAAEGDGEEGTDHRRRRRRRRRRRGAERGEQPETALHPAGEEAAQEDAGEDTEAAFAAEAPREPGEEAEAPQARRQPAPEPAQGREDGGRDRHRRRRDRHERRAQGAEPPRAEPYRGPTPANPFGNGIIDIFDVIEQSAELAPAQATPASPAALIEGNLAKDSLAGDSAADSAVGDILDVAETLAVSEPDSVPAIAEPTVAEPVLAEPTAVEAEAPAKPRRRRAATARKAATKATEQPAPVEDGAAPATEAEEAAGDAPGETTEETTGETTGESPEATPAKPARKRTTRAATSTTASTTRARKARPAAETPADAESTANAEGAAEAAPAKPARKRTARAAASATASTPRARKAKPAAEKPADDAASETTDAAGETTVAKPRRARKTPARAKAATGAGTASTPEPAAPEAGSPAVQPIVIDGSSPAPVRKTGWWRR